MKKLVVTSLLVLTITGVTMTTAHAEGQGPCTGWFSHIRPAMGQARVRHRVEHLIDCAVRIWPVPGGTFQARAIVERESGYWPWAYNPSGCAGLFQQMLRFWHVRLSAYWNRSWLWQRPTAFNPRANVIVSVRMAHSAGWGAWA